MATTQKPAGTTPGRKSGGGDESGGMPKATQGGSRGAANATGRHSKEADHSPGSPAELHKTKGTDKPG